MKAALLGLLVAFVQVAVSNAAVCNVLEKSIPLFTFGDDNTFKTIFPADVLSGNVISLSQQEANGGIASYVWSDEKYRLSDGFEATFEFQIDGNSDGFAFVVQNDKITDMIAGTGPRIGFRNNIKRALAVVFGVCPNGDPSNCDEQSVTLYSIDAAGAETEVAQELLSGGKFTNLATNVAKTVKVRYFADVPSVVVLIDNTEVINANLATNLNLLLGERYGHVGFTASTSWSTTANQKILSWDMIVLPSDSKITSLAKVETAWGEQVAYTLLLVDTCGETVPSVPVGFFNTSIAATLTKQDLVNNKEYKVTGWSTSAGGGTWVIKFDLPDLSFANGTWDLNIKVRGIPAEGMPLIGALSVIPPELLEDGFPVWAFGAIAGGIVVVFGVLASVVLRLRKYKKKLSENLEFIEAGKKQEYLDDLTADVNFSYNPMMATLNDLKRQLADKEAELKLMRQSTKLDQGFTIEQLEAQRNDLLEEMNRLKKEEQISQANGPQQSTVQNKQKNRREFQQQKLDI